MGKPVSEFGRLSSFDLVEVYIRCAVTYTRHRTSLKCHGIDILHYAEADFSQKLP